MGTKDRTPEWAYNEGCECGHGPYNHGGGVTTIGRLLGRDSRCIRCDCRLFRRKKP